jgi:hypothetical protein
LDDWASTHIELQDVRYVESPEYFKGILEGLSSYHIEFQFLAVTFGCVHLLLKHSFQTIVSFCHAHIRLQAWKKHARDMRIALISWTIDHIYYQRIVFERWFRLTHQQENVHTVVLSEQRVVPVTIIPAADVDFDFAQNIPDLEYGSDDDRGEDEEEREFVHPPRDFAREPRGWLDPQGFWEGDMPVDIGEEWRPFQMPEDLHFPAFDDLNTVEDSDEEDDEVVGLWRPFDALRRDPGVVRVDDVDADEFFAEVDRVVAEHFHVSDHITRRILLGDMLVVRHEVFSRAGLIGAASTVPQSGLILSAGYPRLPACSVPAESSCFSAIAPF